MKTLYILFPTLFLSIVSLNCVAQPMAAESNIGHCGNLKVKQIDVLRSSTTDTIFCNSWNQNQQEWVDHFITINTYDDGGRLTESVTKLFDTQQQTYKSSTKVIYTYYPNDSIDTKTSFLWNNELNGGDWDYVEKMHYEYDANNLVINTHSWFSPYNSTEWKDLNKVHYSYSEANLKDTVVVEYWNSVQNGWYFSYRYRYYYDEDLCLVDEYADWANNQSGTYILNLRISYLQGEVPGQIQEIEQNFDNTNWQNASRKLITRNSEQKLLSIRFQNWDPSNEIWDTLVMNQEVYHYYPSGLISEIISQSYYFEWVNNMRYGWDYDEDGNMLTSLTQQWNFSDDDWRNQQLCHYPAIQNITGILSDKNKSGKLQVSPNPANDFIRINHDQTPSQHMPLLIFDQYGHLVKTINHTDQEIWVGDLAAGVYFIQFKNEVEFITEKFIKQ
ncbi:MAG: T9SS type A sorting domain-containing protein [Bacteroidetes bacterium]|jgi:hypothetical protein|nr:T9SS type A sorting domain-containing protein [Bacteroidota bacterium]